MSPPSARGAPGRPRPTPLALLAAAAAWACAAGARPPAAAGCEDPACPEPALPVCAAPARDAPALASAFGEGAPPDGTAVRVRGFLHRVRLPRGCRLQLDQPYGTRTPVSAPLVCAPEARAPCCGAFIEGQLAVAEGVAEGGAIRVARLCVVPHEVAPAGPTP